MDPEKLFISGVLRKSNKVAPGSSRWADGEFIFMISVTRPTTAFQSIQAYQAIEQHLLGM